MIETLNTRRGLLTLPCFFPDATRAVIRATDSDQVSGSGIECLMVNTLHLSKHPGTSLIARVGGIHRFMGWDKIIASDSGGFQILSLIAQDAKLGSVTPKGFFYRHDRSSEKQLLTPENCIKKQFEIGSDILFCLDICTHPGAPAEEQKKSVELTLDWAKRCKNEFLQRTDNIEPSKKPMLFAVVQGGENTDLRRRCAEGLMEIGFDGYGYGGWPISKEGGLVDSVAAVAELLPKDAPKHALGIGKPENVVAAFRLGYRMFDCSIVTRDARQKRLYVAIDGGLDVSGSDSFYRYIYLQDEKHLADSGPIDPSCDCLCCRKYSKAYLSHLFSIGDSLACALATVHNLRFYARIMEALRHES